MLVSLAMLGACTAEKKPCHVEGTIAKGTEVAELVIYREGEDPGKEGAIHLTVEDGRFACDIAEEQVEKYCIVDYGEVMEKSMTSRAGDFLVERGAKVNIRVEGDEVTVTSTGKEMRAWLAMQQSAMEKFMPAYEAIEKMDEEEAEKALVRLEDEYGRWELDYYASHPMLAFLLELDGQLQSFRFNSTRLKSKLDIYHSKYEQFHPDHPVHQRIRDEEAKGYQICGGKYNDYDARTADGDVVRASSLYKGHWTLVVCWATWCAPCRKEAQEIIPIYEHYRERGLHAFSLAHEFGSLDTFREVVQQDGYPWPCLADLDDEFRVFEKHGTANSALFLINPEGTIVAVPNDVEELAEALTKCFGE